MTTLLDALRGKRFGLVLSAGYFGFYGHAGFLGGLADAGLVPSAYSGTSAGGLVAAHAAAGLSPERVAELILRQTRKHFWDPDPVGAVVALLRGGHGLSGLLKGERFRHLLRDALPVHAFEQCQKPLVLVATNLSKAQAEVFTSGDLVSAVHATCAYPGLFRAVPIGRELFWDGGIVDKAPALALADSEAGQALDALLVHYLPSRTGETLAGAWAYAKGMGAGLSAVRREHFALQRRLLAARGLPTYVVRSELPPVSPSSMERGRVALDAARESLTRALATPAETFLDA